MVSQFLKKVVNFYLKDKNLAYLLEKGKHYFLKIQYPINCKDKSSSFITHNPTFALSDKTNQLLVSSESNSVNSCVCLECLSLIRTLQTALIYDLIMQKKCS